MTTPGAWVLPDGDSCIALLGILDAGLGDPVPEIGASDCRGCGTHVIRLRPC